MADSSAETDDSASARFTEFFRPTSSRATIILALVAMVLLAAALRMWRLDYGLPHFRYPDEGKYIHLAESYLKDRQVPNPHYFRNPPFFSLVVLGTTALLNALHVPVVETYNLVMVSRTLSAFLGTLSILLLFLIGERLSGRKVGLVAASFLAVNFLAVRSSHQGVNDMMMLTLLLLCIYFFVRGASGELGAEGLQRGFLVAAFVGGIGVSTKYNSAIGLLPLGGFVLLRWVGWLRTGPLRHRWPVILKEAGTLAGWFIVGLLAGNPWILDSPKEVWDGFLSQVDVASACFGGQELSPMSLQVVEALAQGSGAAVLLLAAAGLVLVGRGRCLALQLLALMTLIYIAYFAFLSKALYARFLIPSLPGIGLLAAISIERLVLGVNPRFRMLLFVALVGLSLSQPLFNSLQHLRIISQPDTRISAGQWARAHIPPATHWYYFLRKDAINVASFGFQESQPAQLTTDLKFERGYYLVTSYDIRQGCLSQDDVRVQKLINLMSRQGVLVYHDNPTPAYSGPTILENIASPYYRLGTIERGGPEVWIVQVER